MADAWTNLSRTSGDAYERMCGTSGDAWARLAGSTGDAWVRLLATCTELGEVIGIFRKNVKMGNRMSM